MYKLNSALVLASNSPRRKELLADCGFEFEVYASNLDESILTYSSGKVAETPSEFVLRLAKAKAEAVATLYPNSFVLGADTDVVLGSKIFGKPQNPAEVVEMLQLLSGSTHKVLGAIALVNLAKNFSIVKLSETEVTFRALSLAELKAYAATKEPYDKAGSYAAQGLGASFVKSINGSYTNVVGLDLGLVIDIFRQADLLV
jgi:septum formation protein